MFCVAIISLSPVNCLSVVVWSCMPVVARQEAKVKGGEAWSTDNRGEDLQHHKS